MTNFLKLLFVLAIFGALTACGGMSFDAAEFDARTDGLGGVENTSPAAGHNDGGPGDQGDTGR